MGSRPYSLRKKSFEGHNWNEDAAADPDRRDFATSDRLIGAVATNTKKSCGLRGSDRKGFCVVLHVPTVAGISNRQITAAFTCPCLLERNRVLAFGERLTRDTRA